jgi:heme/copper-type cytochrome/quinol oxidase subunit 2
VLHGGLNGSFPLTVQALASRDYAEEVRGIADALMLLLSGTSIVVSLILTVFIVFNTKNREIEQS